MTRRRSAFPRRGEPRGRDGQRRERTRSCARLARAAAAGCDQDFANGAPPGGAERLSVHLQRHLHLYRGRGKGRDRRSGPRRRCASLRAARRGSTASRSRPFSSPIPIAIIVWAQRSSARRRARGSSAPRRSCLAAMARPASIPPMTATIRLTRFSPMASVGRAPAIRSRPSPRPGIAPIICASRSWSKTRCFLAITSWPGRRRSSRPPTVRCAPTWTRSTSCAGAPRRSIGPGHGGPVVEPQRYLRALIHHRRLREASILNALGGGPQTIPALVAKVYVGLNPALTRAAGLSTLAHLEDLSERRLVVAEVEDGAELRFRLA